MARNIIVFWGPMILKILGVVPLAWFEATLYWWSLIGVFVLVVAVVDSWRLDKKCL